MPGWLRRLLALLFPTESGPEASPVDVFENAIRASRQRFLDLRATASPLFTSLDALRRQEAARLAEIEKSREAAAALLRDRRDREALEAAARQGKLEADLAATRREIDDLARPVARVEDQLRRIEAEVRDLERERDRSATLLKSADARLAVDRILAAGAPDAQAASLAEAREAVEMRLEKARTVEELTTSSERDRMLALDEAVEEQEARARLEALRADLQLPRGAEVRALPGETGERRDSAGSRKGDTSS